MNMVLGLLADAANMTENGKLNVLGEFNLLWADKFPFVWPQMVLVLRLEATSGEGPMHELEIKVIDEDGKPLGPQLKGRVNMGNPWRPGSPHRTQVVLTIQGVVFPSEGTYSFVILGDKHEIGSIQLHVRPVAERPTK